MSQLVESLRRRFPLAVSNDIVGTHGDPKEGKTFWQQVFPPGTSFGLEFLAWESTKEHALAQGSAPDIAGFHGKLGQEEKFRWANPVDWAKVVLLNGWIQHTEELIARAGQVMAQRSTRADSLYVLVHQPEAQQFLTHLPIVPKGVTLAIENHPLPDSVKKARDIRDHLQAAGREAVVVFDLVHSLLSRPGMNYGQSWRVMLQELDQAGRCLVHLPIGTNMADSLDPSRVTSAMWFELAAVLKKHQSFVIIEHQLSGFQEVLRTVPGQRDELVTRARQLIEVLRKHGVIVVE